MGMSIVDPRVLLVVVPALLLAACGTMRAQLTYHQFAAILSDDLPTASDKGTGRPYGS